MKQFLRKIFCKYTCPFCLHPTNQFDPLGIDNERLKSIKSLVQVKEMQNVSNVIQQIEKDLYIFILKI